MMWFLLLLLYTAHVELVITQGENRLYLNGTNPCEGHIEVYHNGERGFVGDQSWSDDNEIVVCQSTYCGERNDSSLETVQWTIEKVWLNKLNCSKHPKNLWECEHPGFGVSSHIAGDLRKIQCSNKIKLRLAGHHCMGAVEYSTDDGKTWSGFFCGDGWGEPESSLSCRITECGKFTGKKPELESEVLKRFSRSTKMKAKCSGIKDPDHLWQCVTGESSTCSQPASVICEGSERLQIKGNTSSNVCSGQLQRQNDQGDWESIKESKISADKWCPQMHCGLTYNKSTSDKDIQLECSDKVKVLLMDNNKESYCYGEVYVEVNDTRQPVCASSWKDKDAEVVCRELGCGKMISREDTNKKTSGIMDKVDCSGKESSLWHCKAQHDNKLMCTSTAYVVCAGSVNVSLMDGPGKCAGRVEIQYKGQWRKVDKNKWTDISSDVVCKQMGCGKKREHENFFQGSSEFLTKAIECSDKKQNISECFTDNSNLGGRGNQEAVGIICTEHKVVILEGNTACSGKVKIVQGKETYWLSGSSKTWNPESAATVCQQMHCGNANHSAVGNISTSQLTSYNCPFIKASLFDCEKVKLPSDHTSTIAFVTCSEKIQMTLTNVTDCWGKVDICVGNKCGGVSADTWTTKKSDLLCKTLDCGDRALTATSKPPKSKVIFKSLHMTEETTNLEQCNFVINDKNDIDYDPAYVVCSGSVKSEMDVSRDKCSGNVKVWYGGILLPVCKDALQDSNTQKTICEELGCGQADKVIDYFGSKPQVNFVISKIECSGDSKTLKACNTSFTTSTDSCLLGGLQCSSWSKIQLTETEQACSGAVSVVSQGKISPVSVQGWTREAGNRLCKDLGCGSLKSTKTITLDLSWATNFSCAGGKDPENIWKCENETFVLDKGNKKVERVLIGCQDEPKVNLSQKCHGEVMINDHKVCSSTWTDRNSQLVCQQECGNAIPGVPSLTTPGRNMDYYHVGCESIHYKLGNCKRFKEKCDKKLVYVSCTGSVKFNTTKYCGGQIKVMYRGKLEKVCLLKSFTPEMREKLCKSIGCGAYNESITRREKQNKLKEKLETTLDCSSKEDIQDINYCVKYEPCNSVPAEIYCNGYVIPPPPPPPLNPVPIILGVVFLLVLVILIVVFLRIYIVRKNKKSKNFSTRMLPRQEEEFESGNYEDVTDKENEMEDLSRGRFLPEVITENDMHSASSLPYDDIDDMLEVQHLSSQVATSGASGDNYMREGALDQSEDGVTYEVDDPQENYDDIEAGPEITATEAEIHETPQTAPESATAPPPELVEGDDDYLVPGVDG